MKTLDYKEIDYFNNEIISSFNKICPKSSNTINSQTKKISPAGLTLVGFLDKNIWKDISDILSETYDFKKVDNPHITLLGLSENYTSSKDEKLITESISIFFQNYHNKKYQIKFKHIRPGTNFTNKLEQKDMESNGTIIAMAEMDMPDVRQFCEDRINLSKYLDNLKIFNNSLKPKHNTVWSTLGYFDKDDFDITSNLYEFFKKFRSLEQSYTLRQLDICKYEYKSLNNYKGIKSILLSN